MNGPEEETCGVATASALELDTEAAIPTMLIKERTTAASHPAIRRPLMIVPPFPIGLRAPTAGATVA